MSARLSSRPSLAARPQVRTAFPGRRLGAPPDLAAFAPGPARRLRAPRRATSRRAGQTAVAAVLALLLRGPAPAQAPPAPGEQLPVVRHVLGNGMTFLILERRQSPTVAFVVHYPVGSVNEKPGATGAAHLLEHLLFKGSREIGTRDWGAERAALAAVDQVRDSMVAELRADSPDATGAERLADVLAKLEDDAHIYVIPNEFDRILSKAGARNLNATTTHEATSYFVELPKNRAELWFALESDRAARPVFREFHTELDVALEERRTRLEASPGGALEVALLAAAFREHPYGVPVAGLASDAERLRRRDVEDFFRDNYGARNAVVAVVGHVDPEQAVAWAETYFGGLPAGAPLPPPPPPEPEQAGERRLVVPFDAEPRLLIGWKAAGGSHADAPALSVLAALLAGGRTTPLYRRLVTGDRSAVHVSARLGPGSAHPGLFIVSAVPRSPHRPEAVERAVHEEIERMKAEGPEPAALARIRNQMRAGEYRRLASNLQLAIQLAASEAALDDWRETFRWSGKIARVTPEDVRRVASRYLVADKRTVATMVRKASQRQ